MEKEKALLEGSSHDKYITGASAVRLHRLLLEEKVDAVAHRQPTPTAGSIDVCWGRVSEGKVVILFSNFLKI